MTMLTRWEPFRDMALLQDRMNRLFGETPALWNREEEPTMAFAPPVDIYEDEHGLVLKVEVPGMTEKDLDVRIENQTLTVSGERKFEKEEKKENFHRVERRYGSFSRSFTLPPTVDPEKVTADYVNGVLKVTLAKKEEAKPKQIQVTVGAPKVIGGKPEGKAA